MPESREAHDEKPEATRAVITRRAFLKYLLLTVGAALSAPFLPRPVFCAPRTIITRRIPRTDEHLPVIGMGTWQTFHVGSDTRLRDARTDVLRTFLKMGGGMVDSSPMYGSAEQVLGYTLERIDDSSSLFSATKIWTPFTGQGISQIMDSHEYWGLEQFDLLQVHGDDAMRAALALCHSRGLYDARSVARAIIRRAA